MSFVTSCYSCQVHGDLSCNDFRRVFSTSGLGVAIGVHGSDSNTHTNVNDGSEPDNARYFFGVKRGIGWDSKNTNHTQRALALAWNVYMDASSISPHDAYHFQVCSHTTTRQSYLPRAKLAHGHCWCGFGLRYDNVDFPRVGFHN